MSVLYAEVPCFYALVEQAADPALGDRPLLVGGHPRKGGTVQSATPDALAAGVALGMPVMEALEHCPRARVRRTDMRRYRATSARLRACFRRVLDRVETAGLGAAYFDVRGSADGPAELARRLRARVSEELGLPLRVGIAGPKFLARLAAEEAGDAGVRIVAAGEEAAFLAPLPVSRLPGVGPATEGSLVALGAETIGALARLERARVEAALGGHGRTIWNLARGEDPAGVRVARHRKSLSQESSFSSEESDTKVILGLVGDLSARLEQALRLEELRARRITLKLRYADQEVSTRTRTLDAAVDSAADIEAEVARLLDRTQAGERPVRAVGVALAALTPRDRDDRQLPLFPRP